MAYNTLSITGTSELVLADTADDVVTSVVFEVSSASSLSMVVKAKVESTNTSQSCQFINLATGAVSSAGTAITANGIYSVYVPGCLVTLTPSAGSATVNWRTIAGRTF